MMSDEELKAAVSLFDEPRFGRYRPDGSFEQVPWNVVDRTDCDDCRWIGGHHDGQVVRAFLATLRASGRLAPAVEGDVVEAAYQKARDATLGLPIGIGIIYETVKIAAPIIAAATEARVREECVKIIQQYSFQQQDVLHEGTKVWDAEQVGASCADIISAIRTGATR